jgi:large subunit ribosomal protein L25
MDRVTLEVEARAPGKSSAARALRRQGIIPGVMYGTGREPVAVQAPATALREALSGDGGRHAILDVQAPGRSSSTPAILKDIQVDPVRGRLTHFDLLEIRMDQEIDSVTTLTLVGEAEGVRLGGGVLDQPTHELHIKGLPAKLPDHIEVDVTALAVGDSIHLRDISPPAGIAFTDDGDLVLASVMAPTRMEEPEVEEGVEGAEGEGAAAEGEEAPDASGEGDEASS